MANKALHRKQRSSRKLLIEFLEDRRVLAAPSDSSPEGESPGESGFWTSLAPVPSASGDVYYRPRAGIRAAEGLSGLLGSGHSIFSSEGRSQRTAIITFRIPETVTEILNGEFTVDITGLVEGPTNWNLDFYGLRIDSTAPVLDPSWHLAGPGDGFTKIADNVATPSNPNPIRVNTAESPELLSFIRAATGGDYITFRLNADSDYNPNGQLQLQGYATPGFRNGLGALADFGLKIEIPLPPELHSKSLAWKEFEGSTSSNGWDAHDYPIEYSYSAQGELVEGSNLNFYWASGDNVESTIGEPIHVIPILPQSSGIQIGTIPRSVINGWGAPPENATHLVMIIDVGPNVDQDPTNNVVSMQVAADLVFEGMEWLLAGGVQGGYSVRGFEDLPHSVELAFYWSADDKWDSEDIASGLSITTPASAGNHPFEIAYTGSALVPVKDHPFLVGVIDAPAPSEAIQEASETNNDLSLNTINDLHIDIAITPSKSDPVKGETLSILTVVENRSPFPVDLKIGREFFFQGRNATDQPALSDIHVLLTPWQKETFSSEIKLDWDWIPRELPLKESHSAFWQNTVKAIAGDIMGALGKLGSAASVAAAFAELKASFLGADTLYLYQQPNAEGAFSVLARPQLFSDPEQDPDAADFVSFSASVDPEKLIAFDNFIADWKLFQVWLTAINLSLSAANVGVSNQLTLQLQRLVDLTGVVDQAWQRAFDPPDPNFKDFVSIDQLFPTNLEIDPWNSLEVYTHLNSAQNRLSAALNGSIDKKDGAIAAGDMTWRMEQLMAASNQSHRRVLIEAQLATLTAFLEPLFERMIGNDAIAIEELQRVGLVPEIETLLQDAGWPEDTIEYIDEDLRQSSSADFQDVNANFLTASSYLKLAASVTEASRLLSETVAFQNTVLGRTIRELDEDELTLLNQQRDDLAQLVFDGNIIARIPSSSIMDRATELARMARTVAIDSGNVEATRDYLEFAYRALVTNPLNRASLTDFLDLVVSLQNQGEISADSSQLILQSVNSIESALSEQAWLVAIDTLQELDLWITDENTQGVTQSSRGVLKNYVEYIQFVLQDLIAQPSLELVDATTQIEIDRSETLAVSPMVVFRESLLGNLGGGQVLVELATSISNKKLGLIAPNETEITESGEILFFGNLIANVRSQSGNRLQILLRSNATAEDVTQLLRMVTIASERQLDGVADSVAVSVMDGSGSQVQFEVLVHERIKFPRWNAMSPADVNNDGKVNPLDALVVVNYLNRGGEVAIPNGELQSPFLDSSRDNRVTPIDALLVINYLNRKGNAEGEQAFQGSSEMVVGMQFFQPHISSVVQDRFRTPFDTSALMVSGANRTAIDFSDSNLGTAWSVEQEVSPLTETNAEQVTEPNYSVVRSIFAEFESEIDHWL